MHFKISVFYMATKLNNDANINELLGRARRYCAGSEQCEDTVRQKLVVWRATPEESDAVVATLTAEGYIDDHRYARSYCEGKIKGHQWGRQKVLYHLRLKHLSRAAVDSGMAAVSDEDYQAALRIATEKKLAELHAPSADDPEVRQKLTAFLVSRGFTIQEINHFLNQ